MPSAREVESTLLTWCALVAQGAVATANDSREANQIAANYSTAGAIVFGSRARGTHRLSLLRGVSDRCTEVATRGASHAPSATCAQ